MSDPVTRRPIEPGGDRVSGRAWLLLALLVAAAATLGYAVGIVSTEGLLLTLLLGAGVLFVLWRLRRWRWDRETERELYGEPRSRMPGRKELAGMLWTGLWVLIMIFSDEVFTGVTEAVMSWLEGLGLARDETEETVQTLLGVLVGALVLWGWISSWRQSRRDRKALRDLAYEESHGP